MGNRSMKLNVSEPKRGGLARKVVKPVIALAAIGALVGVGLGVSSNKKDAPPAAEVAPVKVATIPAVAEPSFVDTFELPAVVEPNKVVEVSAEADGKVEWIGLKKGTVVRKGDPLIRLNTDLLAAQFQMAEAQAKSAQTEFERIKGLLEKGAGTNKEFDIAATQLAITKAQREEARVRLARAHVAAPMTGVLNDVSVEEGEYVTAVPATTVAQIVDTSVVKVVVEVPERDIPFLSVGQRPEICTDVKGSPCTATGTITFISQVADARTRSTRLEITVPNQDGLLRSGQIVQVRLTRQILKNALFIPLLAVIPMEDGKAVYVVEPSPAEAGTGVARRTMVELGIIKGDRVQVRSGLAPGARLIVAGHRFVAAGQKVEVVPESKQLP